MASEKKPWMKWFPTDWRSDPRLRMCSLAARGLWVEMIGIMHEADPYGHLRVGQKAVTDDALAGLVGAPTDQVQTLVSELEEAGVFSRTRDGTIYSRRMTRDEKKRKNAQKNGKKGGNPNLPSSGNARGNDPPDNQRDKGGVKGQVKTQRPEARGQSSNVVATDSTVERGDEAGPPGDLEHWRERCLDALGAAGNPTTTGLHVHTHLARWRDAGCDLEADVVPLIKARAAKAKPQSIRSWGYFGDGPVEAMESRKAPRSSRSPPGQDGDPETPEYWRRKREQRQREREAMAEIGQRKAAGGG